MASHVPSTDRDTLQPEVHHRRLSNRILQLQYLLPALMLLFIATDIVLRFTSLDWLTFRGLEASWVRFPGSDGPFTPNKVYFNPVSYGDLASISNLPQFRELH